jgi:hypothetical protein
MNTLTAAERGTVIRLVRAQARMRRKRGTKGGFVPEPGKQNADLVAAIHLEAILSKLENDHG